MIVVPPLKGTQMTITVAAPVTARPARVRPAATHRAKRAIRVGAGVLVALVLAVEATAAARRCSPVCGRWPGPRPAG